MPTTALTPTLLERAAHELRAEAGRIAHARDTLARELQGLRWEAPVADRFRQSVRRRLTELDDAEHDLRVAATRLQASARELAATSGRT